MLFFIVAWAKRRSTRTTTVLACLSLTTTPWSVRFGIYDPLLLRLIGFVGLGARLRLGRGFGLRWSGFRFGLRPCFLFRLGHSRDLHLGFRHAGALLPGDRFHTRDVAPNDAHARGVLQLTGSPLEAQIELLLLQLEHFVIEL